MLHKPMKEVSAADLEALVTARQEETRQLEFKQQLNLGNDKERSEAAKDISAMANGGGGRVVYGISEKDDGSGRKIASQVMGMTDGGLRDRLASVLASSVRPPVDCELWRVELPGPPDGLHCLVVEVEPNPYVLHMVEAYGEYKYYNRADAAARPMTEDDVRRRYEEIDRLRTGGSQRVATVLGEESALVPSESSWLSLVAVPVASRQDIVDIAALERTWLGGRTFIQDGLVDSMFADLKPDSFGKTATHWPNNLHYVLRIRRDGAVHLGTDKFLRTGQFLPAVVVGAMLDCVTLGLAISQRAG